VAQEAFIAGNDVLVLGDYGLSASWPEQLANIKDTIQFFRERYVSDPVFATRVDAALVRILALKLRLFDGVFDPATAQVNPDAAGEVLPANEAMSAIAKEAVTLLSPNERDLPAILAAAPGRDETVVFITDDRQIKECPQCEPYPAIPPTALQDIALALYGPNTTGQLDPARVASFTFSDLAQFQDAPPVGLTATPTPTAEVAPEDDLTATAAVTAPVSPQSIQQAIEQANMVVFAMLDLNTAYTSTALFRDFLGQRGDLLREKRVVALAFGAPYYLDATEISKLTAYFGVYSRMPAFLEAAVRTLFGELPPTGSPPVSIPALNYSLISQTSPDPNQVIPLTAANVVSDTLATPGPLELKIGNSLQLRAGPILDRNGHSVPDGTPVQFVLAYPSERVEQQQPPVSTRGGAAETLVVIERKGQLEIRAIAEPATASYVIKVNIGDDASSIETIRPTAMPTLTPEPTAVPSATATPEATPTPQPLPAVTQSTGRAAPEGFLVTLLALLATGLAAVLLLTGFGYLRLTQRWRIVLWSWSAGWIVYLLYVSGAPGMDQLSPALGWWGSAVLSVGVAVAVLGIALLAVARRRA